MARLRIMYDFANWTARWVEWSLRERKDHRERKEATVSSGRRGTWRFWISHSYEITFTTFPRPRLFLSQAGQTDGRFSPRFCPLLSCPGLACYAANTDTCLAPAHQGCVLPARWQAQQSRLCLGPAQSFSPRESSSAVKAELTGPHSSWKPKLCGPWGLQEWTLPWGFCYPLPRVVYGTAVRTVHGCISFDTRFS